MMTLNDIIQGDALVVLKTLPDDIFQCVITSPPYFCLRDYGVAGQLGLEKTPEEYVAKMVDVFREARRVLKDDGTLWLNLGDSYWNSNGYARASAEWQREGRNNAPANDRKLPPHDILKVKDLIGIPWRVAFALQADGWYLRQDIIWHKPNPMPESVQDRCTKSHEYIFLLTKNQKYYFDADSIKEECINTEEQQIAKRNKKQHRFNAQEHEAKFVQHNFSKIETVYEKRNKRDVWSVPVKPYSGAHFATYPEELIEPCILAGSKVGDIVLDPFFGSGTTGAVAQKLGRKWVGCELNKNYEKLQNERLAQQGLELA
jgi:DNA modification methylase